MRNVLCRQVDGRCDKLVVDRRKYCQLSSTDDGPVYRINCRPLSGLVDDDDDFIGMAANRLD